MVSDSDTGPLEGNPRSAPQGEAIPIWALSVWEREWPRMDEGMGTQSPEKKVLGVDEDPPHGVQERAA